MTDASQPITHWSVGRGRGLRSSQPYKPCRRPGQTSTPSKDQSSVSDVQTDLSKCSISLASQSRSGTAHVADESSYAAGNGNGSSTKVSADSVMSSAKESSGDRMLSAAGMKSGITKLRAKYSYKANPESPLGQTELSVKQGQELVFLETCADNEMWWRVQTTEDQPQEGFVPASYVELPAEKAAGLPWLAAKQSAEEKELPKCKPEWKPYVSAYNRDGDVTPGNASCANKDQYYCKWCDKQLNGPKPYGAHITSKAHKEEVDLAKEYGTYTED